MDVAELAALLTEKGCTMTINHDGSACVMKDGACIIKGHLKKVFNVVSGL